MSQTNLTIGSLFSGIGGLELGLIQSGLGHVIWQVEKSKFCRDVLAKHWPDVERFEDVREVGKSNLGWVDVLCGGFPCQDISSAGKGKGLSGERSGLWFEFARIIREICPTWVVENVASGAGKWVDQVSASLAKLGYETLPIPISAEDVGAPHQRRRIFLVAYAGGNRRKARIPSRHEAEQPSTGRSSENGLAPYPYGNSESASPEYVQAPWVQEFTETSGWVWRSPVSPVCGSDDVIPHRVDRLRALGNSVVPACSEVVGHIIQQLEIAINKRKRLERSNKCIQQKLSKTR